MSRCVICLTLAVSLSLTCFVGASDRITVPIPHDDSRIRAIVQQSPQSQESAVLLTLIESLATADRTALRRDVLFPNCFGHLSKEKVEEKVGASIEWDSSRYARPSAGAETVFPSTLDKEQIGILDVTPQFYELKGIGGIVVYYAADKRAIAPAVVYLLVDDNFVPLRGEPDVAKRLNWEVSRLKKIKDWLSIPESVEKADNGEWAIKRKGNGES